MELKALKTISLRDPDDGKQARNFKIGDTFDGAELSEERLDLYLERGIVAVVGGTPAKKDDPPDGQEGDEPDASNANLVTFTADGELKVETEPPPAADDTAGVDSTPDPAPRPEPQKPAKAAKKATTRKAGGFGKKKTTKGSRRNG